MQEQQEIRILTLIVVGLLVACVVGYNHFNSLLASERQTSQAFMTDNLNAQADFRALLEADPQRVDCTGFKLKTDIQECQTTEQAKQALGEIQ